MVDRTISFRRKPAVERTVSSERPSAPTPVVARSMSMRRPLRRSGSSFDSLDGGQSTSSGISNVGEPEQQVRKGQRKNGGRGAPTRNSSFQLSFRSTTAADNSLHGSSHHSLRLNDSFSKLIDGLQTSPMLNNSNSLTTSKGYSSTSNRRLLLLLGSFLIAALCAASLVVQASMYRHVRVDAPLSHSTFDRSGSMGIDPDHAASIMDFASNNLQLEQFAADYGSESIVRPITAFIEPPLNDTVPGTGGRDDPADPNYGAVPEFRVPLPPRTHGPRALRQIVYPRARTCADVPHKLPIDRGLQVHPDTGLAVAWNTGSGAKPVDYVEEEAKYCPVELDPFLPWIHDVFSSADGSFVEFIAQNRRRCNTGDNQTDNVNRLIPQVTLLQAVSVQRIDEAEAAHLAPSVWKSGFNASATTRYRLSSLDEADHDGRETRFICRFRATVIDQDTWKPSTRILGETLSRYPFNYEFLSYRKGMRGLLTPKGKDTAFFWTSTLRFRCPVPGHLQRAIVDGHTMLRDGTASVHVDVVPIRTSARYNEVHFPKDHVKVLRRMKFFDADIRWGLNNVLPLVEASGRWENIPVCPPPKPVTVAAPKPDSLAIAAAPRDKAAKKQHTLSACLWSSAVFKARGETKSVNVDTMRRIREWIEFHLMVGFDHIYVYDNSGAHSNETSLAPLLNQYAQVTRIDWPSTVCNNNKPTDDSPGERSSQYAAEASCLARYGPHSEWMATFDTDEYFVPMGNYTDVREVLRDVKKQGTHILSLKSSRGRLRHDMLVPIPATTSTTDNKDMLYQKDPAKLFLEAYNCDSAAYPKPEWADRARKQIYWTDYVLQHFVHYSTATKGLLQTYADWKHGQVAAGSDTTNTEWSQRSLDGPPIQVSSDERHQLVMVHTKTVEPEATVKYETRCRPDNVKLWPKCQIGFPWPSSNTSTNPPNKAAAFDDSQKGYNCFINDRVETFWLPKLKAALAKRDKAIPMMPIMPSRR